jgi:glutamate-1-semialdehyde 2,1-aminomutase
VAGTLAVTRCADPAIQQYCDRLAARLRAGINDVFVRRGLPGFAWGESSAWHVAAGTAITNQTGGDLRVPEGLSATELIGVNTTPLDTKLHLGLMLEGIELFHGGGFLCVKHTEEDVDRSIAAFDTVLGRMADEGDFA